MDAREQLFSLMALAEDHQKAVETALEGLAAERAALAKERAAVAQAAASVADVAGEVRKAAAQAILAIQKTAGEAVGASVRQSLVGVSDAAAKALGEGAKPILGKLSGVVKAASEAEGKLSGAVAAFGWRWAMLAGGAAAGGIVAVLLAAWLAVWWQRHQVEQLAKQKAALLGDIAQLQANVAALEKKGGRIVMATCGGRLCIEASSNQGTDRNGNPLPLGGWTINDGKVPLVIPRGY